jgi:hypothetical protein
MCLDKTWRCQNGALCYVRCPGPEANRQWEAFKEMGRTKGVASEATARELAKLGGIGNRRDS